MLLLSVPLKPLLRSTEKTNGIHNETADIGLNVNWTVFDGLGIQATYEKLKELQNLGELNTRMTIEDFVADLSSEYYNLIRQKIRLHILQCHQPVQADT